MSGTVMIWLLLLLAISVLPLTILFLWWLLQEDTCAPSIPPSLGLLGCESKKRCMEAQEWDRETLRKTMLDGADRVRDSIIWRHMSSQQRLLFTCGRQFWSNNTPVTNAALDAYVEILKEAGE